MGEGRRAAESAFPRVRTVGRSTVLVSFNFPLVILRTASGCRGSCARRSTARNGAEVGKEVRWRAFSDRLGLLACTRLNTLVSSRERIR